MATTLVNTLYPPLVDTFMPAFVYTSEEAYVVFSLSPYNTPEMINKIHVSLVDQKTNEYVLENRAYEAQTKTAVVQGILIKDVENELNLYKDPETELYWVAIPKDYLISETLDTGSTPSKNFKTETWYQAQLRLDCSSKKLNDENVVLSQYILTERPYFSEWSSVTLLRAIPRPVFCFNGMDDYMSDPGIQTGSDGISTRYTYIQQTYPAYNKGFIPIAAQIRWMSPPETNTEYLDHYQITIFSTDNSNIVLVDSGVIYVGNNEKDSVYYLADMNNATVGESYVIHIEAETRNGYKWWDEKTIEIATFNNQNFELEWTFNTILLNSYNDLSEQIVTEEDGFVVGNVKSKQEMYPGYLYIYRSSSADNYQKNEIIQVTYHKGTIDQDFEDKTVCSLLQYRYKAQYHYKDGGTWSPVRTAPMLVFPNFYDMLFLRQDKQLAIRFDGTVSSLKPVVNRVKIDTLGGKYPKFAENARMNYKQFSISGLISAEEDFNRKFLDDNDDEFAPTLEAYDEHIGNEYQVRNDTILNAVEDPFMQGQHDTYLHDNWYWEREFRERVIAWLNDGEPKLFRSMTEGNMIVMLNDISLTPNKTIGRRLYSFNATMYEIEDGNDLQKLHDYGVITIRNDEAAALKAKGKNSDDSDDEDDEIDTIKIVRIQQYNLKNDKYIVGEDLITGSVLVTDSAFGGWVDPITILDQLNQEYTGILKNQKVRNGTILMKNLQIQFTSKPFWMVNNSTLSTEIDGISVDKYLEQFEGQEYSYVAENFLLGYKLRLRLQTDSVEQTEIQYKDIFINPKGYYQIPSDLNVTGLQFFNGEEYELNYILEYQIEYSKESTITKVEKVRDIVGQYTNTFYPNVSLGSTIREQYHQIGYRNVTINETEEISYVVSEQKMQNWTGISFDVTPYALLEIKTVNSNNWEKRLVGQTGVYNLMTEFDIEDVRFLGRRMVQSPNDNRPYLDEWQYVLDESVTGAEDQIYSRYWYNYITTSDPSKIRIEETENLVYWGFSNEYNMQSPNKHWNDLVASSEAQQEYGYLLIANIENPQYNTIYKITDENRENEVFVIYYLDQAWYEVEFSDGDFSVCTAKVPLYGSINYRGTVIKQYFASA